jgi:hypothetical protein
LDLVHVVGGGINVVWASDWATPSKFYSRNKTILTSDNTRWTGSSVVERDEFSIRVQNGSGTDGPMQSVGGLSVNLNSGNLHYTGDTGLGFSDLISPTMTYGYDSANGADATGILRANGWFTNWDERFTTADTGKAYTYQAPSGNRYLGHARRAVGEQCPRAHRAPPVHAVG